MLLEDLLRKKRSEITDRWFQSIIRSYSSDGAKSFSTIKDQFQNPVGFSATKGIGILFDELIGEMNQEHISTALDTILRIRSVQNFTPAQSVSFIFELKNIIRDVIKDITIDDESRRQLDDYDHKIDRLALEAFDIYQQCREKLFELKLGQAKGMVKPFRGFAGKERLRPPIDDHNNNEIKRDLDISKE